MTKILHETIKKEIESILENGLKKNEFEKFCKEEIVNFLERLKNEM